MKISIDRRELAAAIDFVAAVAPARPLHPALAGVMVTTAGDRVTFSVYDYEVAAETTAPAEVEAEGVVLVHAATLSKIVSKLPNTTVHLVLGERELSIRCASVRASLPVMPPGEFATPRFEAEPLLSMSGVRFEDAISRVALCAAKSAPERPVIVGVNMIVADGGVTLAATDRYRIAMMAIECDTSSSVTLTIPATVLREAVKAFESSEEVSLGITESGAVVIEGERGRLLTQTLAGDFPPVARIFPQHPRFTAVVDRDQMLAATSRGALALAPEGALQYAFTEDECTLTGTGESSQIEDGFEVAFDGMEELQVKLRPPLVLDGLSACRAEQVRVWFTHGPDSPRPGPVMFTAGDGYRYLMVANQK